MGTPKQTKPNHKKIKLKINNFRARAEQLQSLERENYQKNKTMSDWWKPIVGAAASLGASAISSGGGKKSQQRANDHNVNFWNLQNDYNHPSAQMQRLQESGLKPNLIYGTPSAASVGNAEKIAPSKATPQKFDSPVAGALQGIQVAATKAQTDNLRTQNTVLEQERQLKEQQVRGTKIKNASDSVALALNSSVFTHDADARRLTVDKLRNEITGTELDNKYKTSTLDNRVQQVKESLDFTISNTKRNQMKNVLDTFEKDLNANGFTRTDDVKIRLGNTALQRLKEYSKSAEVQQNIKKHQWWINLLIPKF